MKPLLIYLIIINATGFLVMLADKYRAKKNLWRIPERTIIGVAILGGSAGCLLGMYTARHKTRHAKFTIGLPFILAVQIVAGIIICSYI